MNVKHVCCKFAALLCAAALLLGLCAVAFAATGSEVDFTFSQNEDGTWTLTGYAGTDSTLILPAEHDGKAVTAIGESCFAGLLCLKKVHIPEGITSIGSYAFECCSALEKVYFPESLRTIGDGAFSGCGKLILADFQEGVTAIGKGAFLCCDALVQLELPQALVELGDFAFADCSALSSVRFAGSGVTTLPDRVFYGCSSLSRLRLPDSIRSIGKRAFSGCEALTNLYFAAPLIELESYAFEGCAKLSSISLQTEVIPTSLFSGCYELSWFSVPEGTVKIEDHAFSSSGISDLSIPASVVDIEPGAFCQMRGSVTLDEENPNYRLIDGSLYTADGKTLMAFFPADPYAEEPQSEFVLPEGVERIASYALAESSLSSVILPDSLKRIDAYAFADTEITDLIIPEGTDVDPDAFRSLNDSGEAPQEEGGEQTVPDIIGSVAGDKNQFREEEFADFHEIANDDFNAWGEAYLAHNEAEGVTLKDHIPYILRYKGEVVPHFMPMTAVQNHDPYMWSQAANAFGDDFEQMYLMMNHGLFTELSRGKMHDNLILYSGLYDSQLMAAAGTQALPSQQQLVDAIGTTFTDPIMISTTTDPGIAAGFGDTLFIIYASREAMEALGAVCIDAVVHSSEKEILMNANARYRLLDVGNMAIQHQDPWDPEPTTFYRGYVKVELLAPEQPELVFDDVTEGAYYHDAVYWAAKNGITAGTSPSTFSPAAGCTRAQVVTFLWRAAGCPEPTEPANPFSDVAETAYYHKAVLWAVEKGITAGTTKTTFAPSASCSRAQVTAFLWRAAGCPEASSASVFTDVPNTAYFAKAAAWAVEKGITKGTSETIFSPNAVCTRGQVAAFLYRAHSES